MLILHFYQGHCSVGLAGIRTHQFLPDFLILDTLQLPWTYNYLSVTKIPAIYKLFIDSRFNYNKYIYLGIV